MMLCPKNNPIKMEGISWEIGFWLAFYHKPMSSTLIQLKDQKGDISSSKLINSHHMIKFGNHRLFYYFDTYDNDVRVILLRKFQSWKN